MGEEKRVGDGELQGVVLGKVEENKKDIFISPSLSTILV